ncbi:MAG TPA: SDR family oxidoreductase [Terriglobales bacterium]|nr:SDR family oxidoreductase [Terriglobales bacterium]
MSLQGKVIIITGAARGIGQEYAHRFAAAGARVVAADISDCSATLELVKKAGGEAIGVKLDVGNAASALAMAESTTNAFGRIDGLVNNAALYATLRGGRFDSIAEADWDAVMAINVKGVWNCCKAVVPRMRQTSGGSIVNISSLAATYGMPFGLHYTTSKAAVIGLTRGLARELGRDGIRVNAVAPGTVLTDATREFFGQKFDKAVERIRTDQTIQRNLMPTDLVGTLVWLLSDASAFVTGQTISVDGGTVMH